MVYFTNTNRLITFEIHKTKVMENEAKNTVAEERAKYGRVDVIAEWKRRRAEDIRQFEELQNDPEYQQRMAKLKGKIVTNGSISSTTK